MMPRFRRKTGAAGDRHAALAWLGIESRREPVVAEPIEDAASKRVVHAADKVAMVVDQRMEWAVRESDLAGRRLQGLVSARIERLTELSAQALATRPGTGALAGGRSDPYPEVLGRRA